MEYLLLTMDAIPEIVLAHYFSCENFNTGWRKMPGLEIMLADEGDWTIELSGKKYVQKPGQISVLPLSVLHRVTTHDSDGERSTHFALHFIYSGAYSTLTEEEFTQQVNSLSSKEIGILNAYQHRLFLPLILDSKETSYFASLFKEILKEWTGKELHSKYSASVIVQKLLVSISRSSVSKVIGNTEKHGRYSKEAVNKAILFISKNYQTIHSLRDITDHINLNPSYLGSIFKSHMGISIVSYINELRVNKAKLLLEGSGLSFSEIGERVGISNPYYFSSLFKRYAGMTMSEYSRIIRR